MEWIRNWIMQVAGIIVLGGICDQIMLEGEMKKYVKLVVGIVLVFAVMRPITGLDHQDIEVRIPSTARAEAQKLRETLDETEQKEIIRIYCQKLARKAEEQIMQSYGCDSSALVEVEEKNDKNFGEVKAIYVKIQAHSDDVDSTAVSEELSRTFGVQKGNISVEIRQKDAKE